MNDEVRFTPIRDIAALERKKEAHVSERQHGKFCDVPIHQGINNRKENKENGAGNKHCICDLRFSKAGCFLHGDAISRVRDNSNQERCVSDDG